MHLNGPGKYDNLCTDVRERSGAVGAVVVIVGGQHGHGFSVQAPPELLASLPQMLEMVAKQMRADFQGARQ